MQLNLPATINEVWSEHDPEFLGQKYNDEKGVECFSQKVFPYFVFLFYQILIKT